MSLQVLTIAITGLPRSRRSRSPSAPSGTDVRTSAGPTPRTSGDCATLRASCWPPCPPFDSYGTARSSCSRAVDCSAEGFPNGQRSVLVGKDLDSPRPGPPGGSQRGDDALQVERPCPQHRRRWTVSSNAAPAIGRQARPRRNAARRRVRDSSGRGARDELGGEQVVAAVVVVAERAEEAPLRVAVPAVELAGAPLGELPPPRNGLTLVAAPPPTGDRARAGLRRG